MKKALKNTFVDRDPIGTERHGGLRIEPRISRLQSARVDRPSSFQPRLTTEILNASSSATRPSIISFSSRIATGWSWIRSKDWRGPLLALIIIGAIAVLLAVKIAEIIKDIPSIKK